MKTPVRFKGKEFRLSCIALVLVMLLGGASASLAQYSTSTIWGSVSTIDGKPLSNALIRWFQNGQPISLETDASGRFRYFFVSPGVRVFSFEHSSTSETGKCEAMAVPGSFLHLEAVLQYKTQSNSDRDTWHVRSNAAEVDVWQPERIITEDRIESLPGAGYLWSFLNHTEPSVVAERYDVGGMNGQSQLLIGVRGSSWTQNQTTVNGLTVNHPAGEASLFIPDMTTSEAIVYSIGDSSSQHTGPGAHLSFISKRGGQELHGQVHSYFQAGALQNTNVTARNRFFGIIESDERWHHFIDSGIQLGGPLGRRPWTYFGSFTDRNMEKRVRNHAMPVSANTSLSIFNLQGQISNRNQINIDWSMQRLHEPESGSSPQVTREASVDRTQNNNTFQGAWTRRISEQSLLDVRLGLALGYVDSKFPENSQSQSRENIFPGYALWGVPDQPDHFYMVGMLSNTISGSPPLATSYDASAFEASTMYSTIRPIFGKPTHQITVEARYECHTLMQKQASGGNVNLLFFEETPNSVRILNTPAKSRDRVEQLELHASDRFSFWRLNFTLGITADSSRGRNLLNSGQSANALRWNNIAGRAGIAFKVMDKFPLVLRAGMAKISHQPITTTWNAVNPEGLGVQLYAWDDINGDKKFQMGEDKQILKVYGSPYATLDPELKNPHTNEIMLGLTQSGVAGLTFHAFGFRRREYNLHSLVNKGVPFSAYTPVQVFDPGLDGIVGTGDDGQVTAFNQNASTLGKDSYLLTNPAGLNGFSEGFELRLNLSSRRVHAEGSITHYRSVASTGPGISARENDTSALLGVFDDPNKAIFSRGSTYFDRGTLGRVWATAELVWGVRWATLLSYQDGLPYSRYLPVKGLNQGVVGILTMQRGPGEAGSRPGLMTAHYETIDTRLAKNFRLKRGKLMATVDIFNVGNRAQPLLQTSVTAPTTYWRIPLRFQTPRSVQLGLKYDW
jgi:hypothetical protein